MKLYNSKHLQVEEFVPLETGKVKMYVCGPTVYNHVHIGNVRPVVVFDTLRRLLEAIGYEVTYVSNYTDVDDKIIREAAIRGIDEKELTEQMIDAYNDIRHQMNAQDLYKTPKVTETMAQIISFVEKLEKEEKAYRTAQGDVYFRTSSLKDYGFLSKQNLEDLKVGARIEENEDKESPLDFVLWKKTEEGIRWNSRWSMGRPGWHTECVVMIQDNLGDLIDIHGGGKDLRFPHHENERAQSLASCGSELANYWMHSGMIDVDGIKMSKSLGNFIFAKDILNKIDANSLRWFLLGTHYRADVNVSDEILANCQKELMKVLDSLKKVNIALQLENVEEKNLAEAEYTKFLEEMQEDLNTPNAYAVIFDLVKKMNTLLRSKDRDNSLLCAYKNTLQKCLDILGIRYENIALTSEEKDLFVNWQQAKEQKDFDAADCYRTSLQQKGLL